MKRKHVEASIEGQRVTVAGWGIEGLPGLTLLSAIYRLEGGRAVVHDKAFVTLIHDGSGRYVACLSGKVKALAVVLEAWQGGGADWTGAAGEEHIEAIRRLEAQVKEARA